jgi:hypothetical protein
VADGVIASPEFRRLQVREAYEAVLGRTADPAALGYWTARLRAGATVDDLRVALLTSDEAWRRAGSNPSGFTDLLYRSVLGRSPDAGGRSFAVSWIEEGRSLRALATGVVTSDEAFRREADDWYRRLLDRAPSGAETARWLAARRVGTPEWTLLAELAASTA